ncbi:MAG: pyruvate-flavodoxin oxidoreductase [Gammaproteobacteria bacterium]|nr:pyruvate-flavodoxin oxidoreductase [Gammaproteobacteria bacterium]
MPNLQPKYTAKMEQTNLFIALAALLIITLMLASTVRRYQELMAEKRARIKRTLRGVDLIQALCDRIAGCPLPVELERLLQQDILVRFQRVKQIDARFEGVDALIADAEHAISQVVESQHFDIQNKPQLQRITGALGELIEFLRSGRLLTPLTAEQAGQYVEQVATLRAESVYRYHMEQARHFQDEDKLHDALGHCNSVKTFLNEHGPDNSQVKAWYAEAETLRKTLSEVQDSSASAT